MFFFIAGVQPKTKVLDPNPRLCPVCGLNRAKLKRIDHYLSVFFIPLFRIKKGEPMLVCDICGPVGAEVGPGGREVAPEPEVGTGELCPMCKAKVEPHFRFCPYCGQRL